jgi:hypothetical protein
MAGLCLIVVAGAAFGAWWIFWSHGGTAARVAQWLKNAECPEVATRCSSFHLLMTGAAFAAPRERRFADQATEFKVIECGGLGGSIDLYRFSSTAARARAVAGYPELHRHRLEAPFAEQVYAGRIFCVSGTEVLVNGLLAEPDPTVAICHRLRFQLYNWPKRGP